jgi:hypothetical protein
VKPYLLLAALGGVLVTAAAAIGGRAAGVGGMIAVAAQAAAVAVLRPAMDAPQGAFLTRWLAGMVIRAVVVGALVAYAATHRTRVEPLAASLGCLGVLLPLLFLETRFLR